MGAWTFVLPRLINILDELKRDPVIPTYVGRRAAASPATGLLRTHEREQRFLVEQALVGEVQAIQQPFRRIAR
jgi:2-oxoglutarate dehydrogenase E1 component